MLGMERQPGSVPGPLKLGAVASFLSYLWESEPCLAEADAIPKLSSIQSQVDKTAVLHMLAAPLAASSCTSTACLVQSW